MAPRVSCPHMKYLNTIQETKAACKQYSEAKKAKAIDKARDMVHKHLSVIIDKAKKEGERDSAIIQVYYPVKHEAAVPIFRFPQPIKFRDKVYVGSVMDPTYHDNHLLTDDNRRIQLYSVAEDATGLNGQFSEKLFRAFFDAFKL